MDQLVQKVCDLHKLTFTSILFDDRQQNILKCIQCMQNSYDFLRAVPIELIEKDDQKVLIESWILSGEKELTNFYKKLKEEMSLSQFNQKVKKIQDQYKQLIVILTRKIETQMELQISKVQREQELKERYLFQYQDLTLWNQIKSIIQYFNFSSTQEINKQIRQTMRSSLNALSQTKQTLSKLLDEIQQTQKQQTSNTFYQEIYQLINQHSIQAQQDMKEKPVFDTQKNCSDKQENQQQNENLNKDVSQKFHFQKKPLQNNYYQQQPSNSHQDNNNNQNYFNQNNNQNSNQQQNNHQKNQNFNFHQYDENSKRQRSNENQQKNLENIKIIMKLISNKTNGCMDQFLRQVETSLSNAKDIFQDLNFQNAYIDEQYPLQFQKLNDIQYENLVRYSKSPDKFQFNKIGEEKEENKPNQDLIQFQSSQYLNSKQFKIRFENNQTLIDNTGNAYQGQILTTNPLRFEKIYTFRISLNKSIINNMVYFGLIPSNFKDSRGLKDSNLGFSFSIMRNTKPQLIFGQEFQDEDKKLEIRINLKDSTIHIFKYPDFQTIYVYNLEEIQKQQDFHFGVQYQTEQQIKITIFDQSIQEI